MYCYEGNVAPVGKILKSNTVIDEFGIPPPMYSVELSGLNSKDSSPKKKQDGELTYEIDPEFLHKKGLWIHAKNWEALEWLSDTQLHYFWHQEDAYTLTSHGIVWAYPNQPLMAKSVCVMPENQGISLEYAFNLPIYGICSDYVGAIDYFRKR